jgi:molecular chaperone DnaK (HSP70)
MILSKVHRHTRSYLGPSYSIRGTVVSVPASFTFRQRQTIRDAVAVADIGPSRNISAAIATCLEHMFRPQPHPMRNTLFVGLGVGYLEVAVFEIGDVNTANPAEGASILEAKAVNWEYMVTREYFTGFLCDLLLEEANHTIQEVTSRDGMTPRAMHLVRTACEQAKCELSSRSWTHIKIEQEDTASSLR